MKKFDEFDYCWNYFNLHASQRMTTFNFYLVISGFLFNGIVTCYPANKPISIILAICIALISLVFYFLDKRVKTLIRIAEAEIIDLEKSLNINSRIFTKESEKSKDSYKLFQSYSGCFKLVFGIFGTAGICISIYIWTITIPTNHTIGREVIVAQSMKT